MDFKEVVREDGDWIQLTQDSDKWRAFVNTLMNIPVPYEVRNFLNS
jgi:hypothetical protein